MASYPASSTSRTWVLRGAGLLVLASLVIWPVVIVGQQQSGQQSENSNQPPIVSQDRVPDSAPAASPNGAPPYGRPTANQYGRPYAQQQFAPPPALLTIPAGTVVVIRTNEFLSTDRNQIGDQFTATLEQPIIVDGYVVVHRGQTVIGKVRSVQKAGRVKGTSQLGVELTDLTLADGQQAPVFTELWRASGGTSHGADAAVIGGGTALGAIIGSAADWGRGAAIGAGAGAAAGIGAVLLTRGRPTVVPPESELSFRLTDPVKVDTTHSQAAFVPPSQSDFGRGRPPLRRGYGPYGEPYPPYPYAYAPAPCGYYYPCYGYSGPYVGIYPSFGWGFYGRGFYGPRFRRF